MTDHYGQAPEDILPGLFLHSLDLTSQSLAGNLRDRPDDCLHLPLRGEKARTYPAGACLKGADGPVGQWRTM